ncbi:RNA pol II accessory factor, Cdc73 family-domain-containing protein [Hyaloraphidium curvatum]|nr:RNA pol II accessory factor, Cdc73 family-domain-containing protein [Hyaloraphidium curvatum]
MATPARFLRVAFAQRAQSEKPYELRSPSGDRTDDFAAPDNVAVFASPDGPASFPLSAPSGYVSGGAARYTVGEIIFFIANYPADSTQFAHTRYVLACSSRNVGVVSLVEVNRVVAWLETPQDDVVALEDKREVARTERAKEERDGAAPATSGVKRPADSLLSEDDSRKRMRAGFDDVAAVKEITDRERTIQNRHTCMSAKGAGKGFETVRRVGVILLEKLSAGGQALHAANGASRDSRAPPASSSSRSQPQQSRSTSSQSASASKGPTRVFVLLPSSANAMIQLYNANAFFNEKNYRPVTTEMVQTMDKPQYVDVKRTKADGTPIVFRFIDSAGSLKQDEWAKVVGVVAQGQKWQFHNYNPRFREPQELFHAVRGFYFKYQDEVLKDPVKDWNVVTLDLSRSKRHQDSQVVADFWKQMTDWLRQRKPDFV